jgi:uncharacterized C2H2 Zn-finger protein
MDKSWKKVNISKVYCEKCDIVFDSRNEFDKHFEKHSGKVSSEMCPIDTAAEKLWKFFKRKE